MDDDHQKLWNEACQGCIWLRGRLTTDGLKIDCARNMGYRAGMINEEGEPQKAGGCDEWEDVPYLIRRMGNAVGSDIF